MSRNKKLVALLLSILLIAVVVFSVTACTRKKKTNDKKQQEEKIKEIKKKQSMLDELYDFMKIKNMEFDVESEGSKFKTYATERYSYNTEKNLGFVNFDSWVHEFSIDNNEVKIGRRTARTIGFPHYLKGEYARKQFFSIQASMRDKDMYTIAKIHQGGYEFKVEGNVAETTNSNVIESIANSLGSKIPFDKLVKAVFKIENNKLNIKLIADNGKTGVEATMVKEEKSISSVDSYLANNSNYETPVKMDESNNVIKNIKELINNKTQAYKMQILDYSHIIAGRTQEDIQGENDWEKATAKKHEIIQYFGAQEAFKYNSRTKEFYNFKEVNSKKLAMYGTYENSQFRMQSETNDYKFAEQNLVETIFANMDKISYLAKTDEYVLDYKNIPGFEDLLKAVLEIQNKNFFNENKIDTVTLTVIDNKLVVNVNRKISDKESLSSKMADNAVAIQAIVEFSNKLDNVFEADTLAKLEAEYIYNKSEDISNELGELVNLMQSEALTFSTDEQAQYDEIINAIKNGTITTYATCLEMESKSKTLIDSVQSRSKTILKRTILEHIADVRKIADNNLLDTTVEILRDTLAVIDENLEVVNNPETTKETLKTIKEGFADVLNQMTNMIKPRLIQETQDVKETELDDGSGYLYTEDSIKEFYDGVQELENDLKTVDDMVDRAKKLLIVRNTLKVLTRQEEREIEGMRVWYSMPIDVFVDPIKGTIERVKNAFNALGVAKRPQALEMLGRLRTLYNNLKFLKPREKEVTAYNQVKSQIEALKADARYATVSEELKEIVDGLLNHSVNNLEDILKVTERMSKIVKDVSNELSNDELKSEISTFIDNNAVNAEEYSNGEAYKKLLEEIKGKITDAEADSYEQLIEYKTLLNQAKDKLIKKTEVATDEVKKQNLKDLKEKFKLFYNGDIPTQYQAEITDSINGNKQTLIFKNNQYVFNLKTRKGIYKEKANSEDYQGYKINAELGTDNQIISSETNYLESNTITGHLRHQIEKSTFNKNNTVLNGKGFTYLDDETDSPTVPVGIAKIIALLQYKDIDRVVAVNNSDNTVTLIGYRKTKNLKVNDNDFAYYEVFRMKATAEIDSTIDEQITSSMNAKKASSWEEIKNKVDGTYKVEYQIERNVASYGYSDSETIIDDMILRRNGETSHKLGFTSNYQSSAEKQLKMKNDISELIKAIIDGIGDKNEKNPEIDNENILRRFRDVFGIEQSSDEYIGLMKVGNELLMEYNNRDTSYKFAIQFK